MANPLQAHLKFNMAIAIAIILLYCGVLLLTMQPPCTANMVSAHKHHPHHHTHRRPSQSSSRRNCAGNKAAPPNITLYNYLAIQGQNSSVGYNTAQCGRPMQPQPNGYANTFCFDMPLLLEQDLNSKLLGVVQGSYVFISLATPGSTLFVSETFTLNTSSTPQGTFSATGLENIGQVSSKPITGGTNAFVFVTGVAITTPLSNAVDSNGNLVSWFKYDFTFRSASCN